MYIVFDFSSPALHHAENPVTPRSRSWIMCGYLKRRDARIITIINSIDNMNIRNATMSLLGWFRLVRTKPYPKTRGWWVGNQKIEVNSRENLF